MAWETEFVSHTPDKRPKRVEYQTNALAHHSRGERPDRVKVSGKVVHSGYASDGSAFTLYKELTTGKRTRALWEIATEIKREWTNPYFGAAPYLDAMRSLGSINDQYGYDSADSVVRYFLANATTWRGETARRVKAELKGML